MTGSLLFVKPALLMGISVRKTILMLLRISRQNNRCKSREIQVKELTEIIEKATGNGRESLMLNVQIQQDRQVASVSTQPVNVEKQGKPQALIKSGSLRTQNSFSPLFLGNLGVEDIGRPPDGRKQQSL
ncbi:hypothetical protein K7X08_002664 [Anisodus acutangulus]|uniref:Uncharacterized protein n=1 Tax=Anisodus acutangulus TaxID=402998 RepID=A0A9Q1R5N9_9SOLA|nr:hypothetical protein K7X08_002664 [Anisodus acutangulus]